MAKQNATHFSDHVSLIPTFGRSLAYSGFASSNRELKHGQEPQDRYIYIPIDEDEPSRQSSIAKIIFKRRPFLVYYVPYAIQNNIASIPRPKFTNTLEKLFWQCEHNKLTITTHTIQRWFTELLLAISSLESKQLVHLPVHPSRVFIDSQQSLRFRLEWLFLFL